MSSLQLWSIYGTSLATAGMYSYWRGRRGVELVLDTISYGMIVGTGVHAAVWYTYKGRPALLNGTAGMGTLSKNAIHYLSQIEPDRLYTAMKESGIVVAPVPANPSIVLQDDE